MYKRQMTQIWLFLGAIGMLTMSAPSAIAQVGANDGLKATILPTQYLRKFDPVTVVFNQEVASKLGAEDHGEKYMKFKPSFVGAYRWLDKKTLEFRPAEAWPALSRIMIIVPKGIQGSAQLVTASPSIRILRTLLPRPSQMSPSPGSEDKQDVRKIKLSFPQRLPLSQLKQAIELTLTALPGVKGSGPQKTLAAHQWKLKAIVTQSKSKEASYWLIFPQALPKAQQVILQLRLALPGAKSNAEVPMWSASFTTQKPFRLQKVRCKNQSVQIAWGKAHYPQEQALNCGGSASYPTLIFSRPLGNTNPGMLRQLIRFSPTVAGIQPVLAGTHVFFKGNYQRNILYRMTVQANKLNLLDDTKQQLEHQGEQVIFFFLGKKQPFLRWDKGKGILELNGPQMMPLHARSTPKADLRIYQIPAGDRRFWPYPKKSVSVDETTRPSGPGERAKVPASPQYHRILQRTQQHLKLLGTPVISKIVQFPADPEGEGHRFGLNLAKTLRPLLQKKSKKGHHFLVGLRLLNGTSIRHYIWIQVTDLALTSIEEKNQVRFVVTSLKTASPIVGANVSIEGFVSSKHRKWKTLWQGTTDKSGYAKMRLGKNMGVPVLIKVRSGFDTLLLDTRNPPPVFIANHWWPSYRDWLSWTSKSIKKPKPSRFQAHLFPERPVYRPNESIYLKGIVRERVNGSLAIPSSVDLKLVISGPKQKRWEYTNFKLTKQGGIFKRFKPSDPPSGRYTAQLYWQINKKQKVSLASRSFRIEEYRLPLFEVQVISRKQYPADAPFNISASARYFAGGMVVGRPIKWRVIEQFINYRPVGRKGYRFSSSHRYNRSNRSSSRVLVSQKTKLGKQGQATLQLDPSKSLDLRPRRYDIEAVVTGPDGRDIAGRNSVKVLPPFILGVKLKQRFKLQPGLIKADIIAVDLNGKLKAGIPLEISLLRREWHSQLVETDFIRGGVKYQTDIVDKLVAKCKIKTSAKSIHCPLDAKRSGVYILRVRARDKMGRLQGVSIDMYVRGKQRLAWERPKAGVFKLTTDKKSYQVGDTAKVLIRSPFQEARALVIIEDPQETKYQWLDIKGSQGFIHIPVKENHAPNLPFHVLLMRGRVAAPASENIDPGRPRTIASSLSLKVAPRNNQIMVALKMPAKARPQETIAVEISLKDPSGKALSGEVTLWAVDRAALSLGKEGALNPLGAFIKKRTSNVRVRDSRNLVIGRIPRKADNPGGGGGENAGSRSMVRRNFKTVAYYNPSILIGPTGTATITIQLPDDLTTFAIRAVATSGTARFGYKWKPLLVRLPVMVQRTLPRFVRPGDQFVAGGIARVVEGPGGSGTTTAIAQGAQVIGSATKKMTLDKTKAVKAFFSFAVPTKDQNKISIQIKVQRDKDKEKDAFELKLPVRPDRKRIYIVKEKMLSSLGQRFSMMKQWPEAIRAGSGKMEILFAGHGEVLRSIAALEYLVQYPYGCTEQRVSRAYPLLVMQRTLRGYALKRLTSKRIQSAVKQTIRYLKTATNRDGLFGYWPGSTGYVWLSAYVVPFLVEAKQAGYKVPADLLKKPIHALRRSLRSDYTWALSSYQLDGRAEVLHALAVANAHEPGYIRELFNQRQSLDLFGRSRLLLAMLKNKTRHSMRIRQLTSELWSRIILQKKKGGWSFAGIQFARKSNWGNLYLSSQTRTLAGLLEAMVQASPSDKRINALKSALLDKKIAKKYGYGWREDGVGDSWGSTQENARALLALRAFLKHRKQPLPKLAFRWKTEGVLGAQWSQVQTFGGNRSDLWATNIKSDAPPRFWLQGLSNGLKQPLWVRARISYIPAQKGSQATAMNKGLSIQRSTEIVGSKGKPSRFFDVKAGTVQKVAFGQILEEKVRIISDKYQYNVVIEVPIAAGVEVMNPALKVTSAQAKPSKANTLQPTHLEFLDDRVRFFFERLPTGDHKLYFRVRATTQGRFVYPSTFGELMYRPSVFGRSPGYTLVIKP